MAEFCKDCAENLFGDDPKYNDFAGRCKQDQVVGLLCEGCGPGNFDHEGKRWEPVECSCGHKPGDHNGDTWECEMECPCREYVEKEDDNESQPTPV